MSKEATEDYLDAIKARSEAFKPEEWRMVTKEPETETEEEAHGRAPLTHGYFKYVNGERVFSTAYLIYGLETVGNHECGAMEKPAAEFVYHALSDIPKLVAEVERLRNLCGELYQVAGVLNASAKVLDNILAGAQGEPLPHETLLPFTNEEEG